jgi:hypothetical protein
MLQTREMANLRGDRSLHALEFAGSEVGIGTPVEVRQELGSETGAFRRRDVTIRDDR